MERRPKTISRTVDIGGQPVEVAVDEDGNVSASLSMNVNGQNYVLPIETTITQITQMGVNEANPNSCEKEPDSTEVMLPVAGFFEKYKLGLIGSEIGDRVWSASMRAKNRGYHYFVISADDFEYVKTKIQNTL
jgi:hypothetical protein